MVHRNIVALNSTGTHFWLRFKPSNFARRMRFGNINNSQAISEPSNRNFCTLKYLTWLMATRIVFNRFSINTFNLKTRKCYRMIFISYIVYGQKRRIRIPTTAHIFIGNQHNFLSLN